MTSPSQLTRPSLATPRAPELARAAPVRLRQLQLLAQRMRLCARRHLSACESTSPRAVFKGSMSLRCDIALAAYSAESDQATRIVARPSGHDAAATASAPGMVLEALCAMRSVTAAMPLRATAREADPRTRREERASGTHASCSRLRTLAICHTYEQYQACFLTHRPNGLTDRPGLTRLLARLMRHFWRCETGRLWAP